MKATSIRPTHPRKVKTLQQQNEKKVDEKKVSTSINVSKVMSKTKRPDFTELQKPLVTSFSCMSDVIEAFTKGTDELRELVNYECELIYECKICRSLFRSLSNFIQHKRIHCQERIRDLKTYTNGEVSDKVVHINGNNAKGQLLTTRKTIRKDIYDLLRKVGNVTEEPVPEHFFTKDLKETDAALLSFFKQEGKAESEEKSATLGPEGFIVGVNATNSSTGETVERDLNHNSGELKKNEDGVNRSNHNSSKQLMNYEGLFNSQKKVTSSSTCPKLRHCYVCPLCQRYFCRIWSVQRHLHSVHKKLAEQIRKLQKKIKVKMVSVDQLKLRSPGGGSLLPELKTPDKEPESVKAVIPHSPSFRDSYPLVVNQTYKRESSNGNLPNKTSILEVRAYDKRPSTESYTANSMHNLPQPRVLLTKTNFSTIMPISPSKTQVATDESSSRMNPPKKPKLEPDLSWLKKGPSVPIIHGPLTRNARALYGNTASNHLLDNDSKSLRDLKGDNSDLTEPTRKFGNNRVSDSNSDAEASSDSEADALESDEENVDSDAKNVDGLSNVNSELDDPSRDRCEEGINEDHSSSEDNVHSLASSIDSFDSMPNKEDNLLGGDQASTSGVETDISPDVDQPNMSGDDSGDIERLIYEYSKPQSPDPISTCSKPTDKPANGGAEGRNDFCKEKPISEPKCSKENGNFKRDVYSNPNSSSTKYRIQNSNSVSLQSKTAEPVNGLHRRNSSVNYVVESVKKTNELIQNVGSDDSNDLSTDTPEQLESRVMEVIFGSLPSTSFCLSTNNDDGSNSS